MESTHQGVGKKGFGEIVKLVLCTLLACEESEKGKKIEEKQSIYFQRPEPEAGLVLVGDLRLKQQPHREKKAIILHIVSPAKTRVSSIIVWLVAGESQYSSGFGRASKVFSNFGQARRIIAERFVQLFESKEK